MCLSLYDYQSKASRYRNGLIYLKNKVTTNQKHTKDSQKSKRTQAYYKIKPSNHKRKKKKEQRRNTKSTGRQGLKWQ